MATGRCRAPARGAPRKTRERLSSSEKDEAPEAFVDLEGDSSSTSGESEGEEGCAELLETLQQQQQQKQQKQRPAAAAARKCDGAAEGTLQLLQDEEDEEARELSLFASPAVGLAAVTPAVCC